jgi:hypothetical protein
VEVKEIVKLAAIYLQLEEVLALETFGGDVAEADANTAKNLELLVRCLNLVYNELASDYVPLKHSEEVLVEDGEIDINTLEKRLISVLKLANKDGKNVKYKVYPTAIKIENGTYDLEYSYLPNEVELTDSIEEFGGKLTERIIAYGVASEYTLISGLFDEAELWKKRFLDSLIVATGKKSEIKMPARRWF